MELLSTNAIDNPSKHRHGANISIRLFRETAPFSRLLRHAVDTGNILDLTPGPHEGGGLVIGATCNTDWDKYILIKKLEYFKINNELIWVR